MPENSVAVTPKFEKEQSTKEGLTMKIFLTGGTGFLGKHVVQRLLKEDYELYILTRKPQDNLLFKNPKITMIEGSLETIQDWKLCLQNVDVVVHMATPDVFWGKWSFYKKSIVDSTKQLFDASESSGVEKFIYISSESVLQYKKDLLWIDESEPYPKLPNSYYGKSKMLAEKKIFSTFFQMTRVIIRPTFIWGKAVDGLKTMAQKIQAGGFMWINNGDISMEMVHVDNVAQAIALAIEKTNQDNIFFITDDAPKSTKRFLTDMLGIIGVTPPNKSMPKSLAQPVAVLIEGIWKLFHFKKYPPLTRFDLSFISMNRAYNIDKIKSTLGYQPIVDYDTGIKKMSESLQSIE